jgi:phenylalanyl-tRNA synthetase alpha chain
MQTLLAAAVEALTRRWSCPAVIHRPRPLVAVEDNYDRLGYDRGDITRDARYTRYVSDTVMLRSHTSAGIPPALRHLATATPDSATTSGRDVLLVLPGLVYRRDVIDRHHVGTPHQVDLWRITPGAPMTRTDLHDMIDTLVNAVLPAMRWRTQPARHPYTEHGLQIDVQTGAEWVELAECGLAAPHVLAGAGLDPRQWSGLALGMGLDRALMLRKQVPDIRLLRASDPRITAQMLELDPWHPVSMMPPVCRDLSIVTDAGTDEEILGDQARTALGSDVDLLESLSILATTDYQQLPAHVRDRLGIRPDQANRLIRLVLRPIDHTLTDTDANTLRDRVYAALHRGPVMEWTSLSDR